MKGTATITTRTTVTPVTVTEVKSGTVVMRSGSNLIVRTAEGVRMFTQGEVDKRGVKIVRAGKPAQLSDFREGDRLSATIITSMPPRVMTEQEVRATVSTASATAGGAPSASAARASSPAAPQSSSAATTPSASAAPSQSARTLPRTASSWPWVALASVLLLVMGLSLVVMRRLAP